MLPHLPALPAAAFEVVLRPQAVSEKKKRKPEGVGGARRVAGVKTKTANGRVQARHHSLLSHPLLVLPVSHHQIWNGAPPRVRRDAAPRRRAIRPPLFTIEAPSPAAHRPSSTLQRGRVERPAPAAAHRRRRHADHGAVARAPTGWATRECHNAPIVASIVGAGEFLERTPARGSCAALDWRSIGPGAHSPWAPRSTRRAAPGGHLARRCGPPVGKMRQHHQSTKILVVDHSRCIRGESAAALGRPLAGARELEVNELRERRAHPWLPRPARVGCDCSRAANRPPWR